MRRQMQQQLDLELPTVIVLYVRPPPGHAVAEAMLEIFEEHVCAFADIVTRDATCTRTQRKHWRSLGRVWLVSEVATGFRRLADL